MMLNKLKILTISMCTLAVVSACGGGGGGGSGDTREDAVYNASQQHVDNRLVPTMQEFSTRIETLSQSIAAFCPAPDANGVATLQQGWRDLAETWFRLAAYNFGPMNVDVIFPTIQFIDSMRPNGVDYTSAVRTLVNTQIAGTQTLDTAFFDGLVFTNVGILALEVLIFENSGSQSTAVNDIVSEYQLRPRKCELLQGMIAQLDKHGDAVRDGWLVDFNGTGTPYRTLFVDRRLDNGADPVATLMVAVQFYVDYLHKRSVATRTAQISRHNWTNLSRAIDEIETLLSGTGATTISFFSLMESAGFQAEIDIVKGNISAARNAITLEDNALLEPALIALDGNFKREILQGINVDPGINFTDGD